jgi:hypothetical protein
MSRRGGNLCYSHTQPDFEPGPYGIKTVSTRFHPHRSTCQFLRILGGYNTAEKTFWSCSKFLRVSNRTEIRFKSFSTPIDQYWSRCKIEYDQNFFLRRIVLSESIRNWHGLRCGSIRAEPGRYRNGFNSVWTRFKIRLCVTAFPERRPYSKLFWPVLARVDQHLNPD